MELDAAALNSAVDEFRIVSASNGGNLHKSIWRAIQDYIARAKPLSRPDGEAIAGTGGVREALDEIRAICSSRSGDHRRQVSAVLDVVNEARASLANDAPPIAAAAQGVDWDDLHGRLSRAMSTPPAPARAPEPAAQGIEVAIRTLAGGDGETVTFCAPYVDIAGMSTERITVNASWTNRQEWPFLAATLEGCLQAALTAMRDVALASPATHAEEQG